MNRASFYAYSEPNDEDLGGFGSSNNFPNKIKSQKFPKNKISVIVNPTKLDTISEIYNGFNVYVVNNTTTNLNFSAQDSRLDMKVQAKNEDGQWRDIEYLPSSWCGNSYHTLSLKPKYYWTFTTPNYEGEIKTKLRVELKYTDPAEESEKEQNIKEITIYSNEYDGSINPGQFWNKRTYYPNGLMDPYND